MAFSTVAVLLVLLYSVSGAPEQQAAEIYSYRVEVTQMGEEIQGLKDELQHHKILIEERKSEIKVLQEELAELKEVFEEDAEEGENPM